MTPDIAKRFISGTGHQTKFPYLKKPPWHKMLQGAL